jgi:hypothetical protein
MTYGPIVTTGEAALQHELREANNLSRVCNEVGRLTTSCENAKVSSTNGSPFLTIRNAQLYGRSVAAIAINDERFAAGMCAPQRKTPDREKNVLLLIQIKAIPRTSRSTVIKKLPLSKRTRRKLREANMAMMPSMSRTDHGTACVKCGEMLFIPDWSEFVSERLVVNLWCCGRCGDRFETSACMSEDAEFKIIEKDWEQMFPQLLVA